ncbi:Vomp family autotransporter [Bartonella harrusi]|uniref:Vomp family autotransporter n=1 Tax=Bartonella harrusi TaxID=2961895 RepID=A0ABY5EUP5_9HYPH|nr:Vomp family autotransporter [Bartonella harrusi]UTO28536.1 Vomp family autotransporter [Bartonella harrusi]
MGTGIATYLGGGAKYEGGEWTAPSFKVKTFSSDGNTKDENYTSVSAAFEGVGTSFANVNNNITNKFNELTENITNITQEVQGDALLWDKAKSAFVATHGEKEGDAKSNSKITSLQNGAINENSTDAVAGQQLHQLGTGIATYLGGGAKYENGAWTAPKFTVKTFKADGSDVEDKDYSSVSAAFAGVGTSFTNIHKELKKEISQVVSDSLVKWDETTKSINIGKEKDGTAINIANKDKGDRTLSGVKAATQNNQAVNKEQFDKGLKDLSLSLQSDESAVVHYDKKDDDNSSINYASVTLGKGKGSAPVGLHNVADGQIAKDSHDAITGGQINTIGSDVAKFLGGDAAFKDGAFTEPTYNLSQISKEGEIKDAEFKDVGKAFTGLDESIKNVNDRIKEVSQGVAQDSLNWSAKDKAFVAQHGEGDAKSNSKITSLQNGAINENSTDAVAGQQLHQLGTGIATYLGGGAKYENGAWTAPKFTVKTVKADGSDVEDKDYSSVSAAFAGVGTSFTNIHKELKKEISQVVSDSLVKQKKEGDPITIGAETDGTIINLQNKKNENRVISGVTGGTISKDSIEAINGSQLHSFGDKIASYLGGGSKYENGVWTAPKFTVKTVNEEGKVSDATYDDVTTAFAGVGTSFANVNNNITNKFNELTENITNITQEVQGDALLWDKAKSAFVATHGEKEGDAKSNSKITSLQNGTINENSTDAVAGQQLHQLGTGIATYLGGGAKYENGAWTAPKFTVKTVKADGSDVEDKDYSSVSAAFAGVGTSFTNIHKELKKEINQVVSDSLVKQKKEGDPITIGAETDGTIINLQNKKNENRVISGVTGGTISKDSIEAINGSQLHSFGDKIATYLGGGAKYEDGAWTAPKFMLKSFKEDGVIADATYDDVAAAFAGVGNSFTKIQDSFTNVKNEIEKEIATVQGDALLWSGDKKAFVAEHGEGKERANSKITSLSNGTIAAGSTDAVNGSQLFETNKNVTTYLGGGAGYANGEWHKPDFKVNIVKEDGSAVEEKSYQTVAEAFAGVGSSFTNIHKELKTEINKVVGDSLVKQNEETHVISIGGEKSGTEVKLASIDGASRTLSGVKSGVLSKESTEAVNGSQLFVTNQNVSTVSNNLETAATNIAKSFGGGAKYENSTWTAPTFTVKSFEEDGKTEDKEYLDVASAFVGVGNSFTNVNNRITNVKDEISKKISQVVSDSLVKQDEETKVIKIGAEKEGTAITIANSNGDARSLSGVKAAILSEGSTEAVNGGQLYSLHTTLAQYFGGGAKYENGVWTAPSFNVAQFSSDGSFSTKESHDVAGAFEAVSESMTHINDRIKDVSDNIDKNNLHWNEEQGAYDASHNGEASHITNVANGEIKEGSQDAVNGGQLWETNDRVTKVENRVDTIDKHVQDIATAVTDGAVNYDKDDNGKKTNSITLVGGNESDPVLIDNVADGKIETGSKQAVTGGQLHDYTKDQMKIVLDDAKKYTDEQVSSFVNNGVNEAKSYTDMKFETLSYAVEDVRKEARQAAAIGLAVSNLRYYDIPGSLSVSFGSGVWRSQSAFAIGAGYTSEDGNIRSNLSVTSAGGHFGIGAGITLRLR